MKDGFTEDSALHLKVKESILELIRNGEFKPDTKLPTEAEFCEKYGVSRTTIRTALQQLSTEGHIYRQQGRGTFVSSNKVKQRLTSTVENFSKQMAMQGKNPLIKVINLEVIPADPFLADVFELSEGDPVNVLERIRYADDEPLQYEKAFLPWKKTPSLNRQACEKSLYNLLQTQYNLKIKKTIEHLEISLPEEEISNLLKIKPETPCFALETYAHIEDGSLIEYSKTMFRGDYAHFIIERNYE
ncbi:GntR family transcriptional regulator [Cytobacillus oceanisediminis]|uniref:GntR family transcriptional regulator n=1 Tax=Cytobacillus TaxID=2675230 RepID=UPI00204222D5|nr:GntR family transcriptional regulator [Cytobacillus oceanisediminis]MCM3246150.1 GntR family transcriptional regulator [Cytobacillus oceanisediminis]